MENHTVSLSCSISPPFFPTKGTNILSFQIVQLMGILPLQRSWISLFIVILPSRINKYAKTSSNNYVGGNPVEGLRKLRNVLEILTWLREFDSGSTGLLFPEMLLSVVRGVRGRVLGLPRGPGSRSRWAVDRWYWRLFRVLYNQNKFREKKLP